MPRCRLPSPLPAAAADSRRTRTVAGAVAVAVAAARPRPALVVVPRLRSRPRRPPPAARLPGAASAPTRRPRATVRGALLLLGCWLAVAEPAAGALAPRRGADPCSRAGHGPAGWAVGLAAGRPAPGPAGLRPAGAPVRSRPPRSRPRRRAGRPGARRRSRRRRLRRRARRSRRRLRAARRRPAHHLRAAGRGDPAWSRGCPRLRPRAPGGRPRRLPLARLPALGPAPGRGLLGPALAAPPRPVRLLPGVRLARARSRGPPPCRGQRHCAPPGRGRASPVRRGDAPAGRRHGAARPTRVCRSA